MKKTSRILLVFGLMFIVGLIAHISYLYYLASAADYPKDSYLSEATNKNALIIVAHDDDAVSMSGTISALCDAGWNVRELCFYQGRKGRDEQRKKDLEKVADLLGMKGIQFYDIVLRRGLDTIEKPWLPVPKAEFPNLYNKEEALSCITDFISLYQPSVVFSLDDVMGGYGHPDHAFISSLLLNLCREREKDTSFSVQRIYQAVFDPAMNEKILKNMEAFQMAKKVYGIDKSPTPDVYVSLKGKEQTKKNALLSYRTEQNSLTKIWPHYSQYPAKLYFSIFDKEYFRVLSKENDYR